MSGDQARRIYELLESHLPAKSREKADLGEVFTPVEMIQTIYDNFPKALLADPKSTFLDPAAGIGNFGVVLYFTLMNTLATKLPNKAKRSAHILEKMIYMVELNSANTVTARKIFADLDSNATPNIAQEDFLKISDGNQGLKYKDWPTHYTAVIGNPPYNIGGTGLEGQKRAHIPFTERGLKILEPRGFLAYICPPSYREAGTPMNALFKEAKGHFSYIRIYGAKETFKLFKIQGRVDGFIYQRDVPGKTTIDDEYQIHTSGLALDLDNHIPNFAHGMFAKLLAQVQRFGKPKAYRTTEQSTTKAATFNCASGRHRVLHLIVKEGRRVYRTSYKSPLTTTPKLFVNGLGLPYVYYDSTGKYHPSQSPVIVERPSAQLVRFAKSPYFYCLAWGLRLTGNNTLPYTFDYVPNFGPKYTFDAFVASLTADEKEFVAKHFAVPTYADKDLIEPCAGRNKTRKVRK